MSKIVKNLLLSLISVSLLLAAFAPVAHAQDDYLPPDDLDIDEVAQMLDRVEYYARECSRYKCPKLDCTTARSLFIDLYKLRENSQYYAFWISRMPQFETNPRVRTRYEKATALFHRLNALLNQTGNAERGRASFSNCLIKLKSPCGDLTEPPEPSPYREYQPALQVDFPSGTEPSKGIAKHPGIWLSMRSFLWSILQDRIFLSTFPVPEPEETWIETNKSSYIPREELELIYSVAHCQTSHLRLNLVRAGSAPGFPGEMDDNIETWLERVAGSNAISIAAPKSEGNYEVRLYDPDSDNVVAFATFSIRSPVPNFGLVGTWRTDDGFELTVNRDGDDLVGNIRKLGLINETREKQEHRELKIGDLFWSFATTIGETEDGRAIYKVYCSEPNFDRWREFELTMESDDSFTLSKMACPVSPGQLKGFVRLWRVRRQPKTDLNTKSANDERDN